MAATAAPTMADAYTGSQRSAGTPVMLTRKARAARRTAVVYHATADRHDLPRLLPALLLCVTGILLTYSVCVPMDNVPERLYWRRQIVFLLGSLTLYITIARAYLPLTRHVVVGSIYTIFCVILPLTVLILGRSTGNGLRWLSLFGVITVQPAEFAKVALLLTLAELVHCPVGTRRTVVVRRQILAVLAAAVPIGLVCLERSFGNTTLLFLIAATVLVTRWFSWPSVLLFMVFGSVVLAPFIVALPSLREPEVCLNHDKIVRHFGAVSPGELRYGLSEKEVGSVVMAGGRPGGLLSHCPSRLFCYLSQRGGWNAMQALRSVRVGGFRGEGWRHGLIAVLGFLPRTVQHTDFAYCVLSEMFGLVGGGFVLLLIAGVILVVLRHGCAAQSPAGWSFALGFAVLIFTQTVVHVGMALRVLPIIGIPLPFFSYGGSVLLSMFAGLGIVARYRDCPDGIAAGKGGEAGGTTGSSAASPEVPNYNQPDLPS